MSSIVKNKIKTFWKLIFVLKIIFWPSNSKSDDDFDDIEQSIKQTYQADRIDRLMVPNSSPIPSDKVLSKRQLLDVLLPFRRKSAKRPSKRPLERPAKRPGNRPKRLPKPKPSVLPRYMFRILLSSFL